MKKRLALLILACTAYCSIHAQDIIYLKKGDPVNCLINTDLLNSDLLYYYVEEESGTTMMFMNYRDVDYVFLGLSGKRYELKLTTNLTHVRLPNTPHGKSILAHKIKLIEIKEKAILSPPVLRHIISLETGFTLHGFKFGYQVMKIRYAYYLPNNLGLGFMTWNIKFRSRYYPDFTFAAPLVSYRNYVKSLSTFVVADGMVGYAYSNRAVRSSWGFSINVGCESILKKHNQFALTYGVGLTELYYRGKVFEGGLFYITAGLRFGL